MADTTTVQRVSRNKIPPGSKVLSPDEVFNHYTKLILKWQPSSEIWPLKYGWVVLGATACTANFFILKQYRQRLKLTGAVYAALTVGCGLVPSMCAPLAHLMYITKDIVNQNDCLGCIHIRALAWQTGCSLLYAVTVNPLLCFLKAQHLATYNVPGYSTPEQRRKMWQLYVKFTRRASGSIYFHGMVNTLAATAVTFGEIKSFVTMNEKLVKKNQEVAELRKKLPQ